MSPLHIASTQGSPAHSPSALAALPVSSAPARPMRFAAPRQAMVAVLLAAGAIGIAPSGAAASTDPVHALSGLPLPAVLRPLPSQGAIAPTTGFGSGAVVQVYKYDGSVQCDADGGIRLEVMARQLARAGVRVIEMRKGSDGRPHPDFCGAPDGTINVYEIDARGLHVAEALGFATLPAGAS
jgi:hypothetical protein